MTTRSAAGIVRAALVAALGGIAGVGADEPPTVDGYGRIDGLYCAAAARLVLDDGRHFEVAASFATGAFVDVRGAALDAPVCGRARRLSGGVVPVPARPAIELTVPVAEWAQHAGDVDALARRFTNARLRLRVLAADTAAAQAAALQIGTQWLQQRPELMVRSIIVPLAADGAARGWRVAFDAFDDTRSIHAATADDVVRLLSAAR